MSQISERGRALILAAAVLDRPNADPDDDLAVLARQLGRAQEQLDKYGVGEQPMNVNRAPFPEALAKMVAQLEYRKGWTFHLMDQDRGQGSRGLTLRIITLTVNSYDPVDQGYRVAHFMPVPPAAFNEQSWRRWLLEQVLLVERHEACEFFKIAGQRPYAPHHGPGNDPYTIFERGTDEEARTMYTGEVRPKQEAT